MSQNLIFDFQSDISEAVFPEVLNNPFSLQVPQIIRTAAAEFQEHITKEAPDWEYDFNVRPGKMFGVLVVQREDESYGYLGTVSGKIPGLAPEHKFVPSVLDESTDNYYFGKGMTELTTIGTRIKNSKSQTEIKELIESRRQKSHNLQQWLFEHYTFSNVRGKEQNVLEIFENSPHGKPPAAAGECAGPKLLQYAFEHNLKPIALAEFWWGKASKNKEREHKVFYPACKSKCRPILEYMLDDQGLFDEAVK